MLLAKRIPKTFWPEAVNWTVHMLNRCPTLAMKNKTPEEAWSGLKPLVEHFRVFGCISHVHVPNNKRVKLDAKSFKCVLLGVNRQWSWEDDGHKQAVLADLEWETDEEEGMEGESNEEEFVADEESREIVGASDQNGGDTSHGENSPCVGRARRPPV
ncbi:hypothetical protein MRB53_030079 [Persea americana]|uniref:Uncharacterized protein n=1 Tax=Persea americana TaxID=3435 RepID=A0ACC2KKL1_PERAE|nr:hypothetical protein MRB53_030079 [Persea americana]